MGCIVVTVRQCLPHDVPRVRIGLRLLRLRRRLRLLLLLLPACRTCHLVRRQDKVTERNRQLILISTAPIPALLFSVLCTLSNVS